MSMYALLRNNPLPSNLEMENAFQGTHWCGSYVQCCSMLFCIYEVMVSCFCNERAKTIIFCEFNNLFTLICLRSFYSDILKTVPRGPFAVNSFYVLVRFLSKCNTVRFTPFLFTYRSIVIPHSKSFGI